MAKIDRIIQDKRAKLEAVKARKTWALTAGEQAKLATAGAAVVAKATRLKESPRAARAMDQVWSGAEDRYKAELRAAEQAKHEEQTSRAKSKVRKGGWF